MWNSLLVFWDQYHGLIIDFAVLALVLLANQLMYRRFWTSYPTREAHLAAHPGCDTADGIVCARRWKGPWPGEAASIAAAGAKPNFIASTRGECGFRVFCRGCMQERDSGVIGLLI